MKPGVMTLRDWRAIYRGAVPTLDPKGMMNPGVLIDP